MRIRAIALAVAMVLSSTAVEAKKIAVVPQEVVMKVAAQEQAIQVQKVAIEADITAAVAQTKITMTFYNPNARALEGQLQLPLDEGQKIIGMALDIGGEMRQAVPVPKQKGQQVFEAVERKQVDPALLEQVSDNQFRLRVYPIPAKGTRTVEITISQALEPSSQGLEYQLPLRFQSLNELNIDINSVLTSASDFQPSLPLNISAQKQGFKASLNAKKSPLPQGLKWVFQAPKSPQVVLQTQQNQRYFMVNIPVPASEQAVRTAPKHLGIVWDASSSREQADITGQLALIEDYVKRQSNGSITMWLVRGGEAATAKTYAIRSGDWSALKQDLPNVAYDGASGVSGWKPNASVDEYWLFSDGINNLQQAAFPSLGQTPLMVFNSQAQANHVALRALAQQHGGEYWHWRDGAGLNQAQQQLWQHSRRMVKIVGDVEQTVVLPSTNHQAMFTVLGQVKAGVKEPRLQVSLSNSTDAHHIDIPLVGASSSVVAALWAGAQIDVLSQNPQLNQQRITELGKQFGIVTPETSLLVLDSVEDYVEHGIAPPPSLQDAYQRLLKQQQTREAQSKSEQLEQAKQDWQEFGEWWRKDFPKDTPKQRVSENNQAMVAEAAAPLAAQAEMAVAADAVMGRSAANVARQKSTAQASEGDKQVSISIQPYQEDSPSIRHLHLTASDVYVAYLREKQKNQLNPSFYLAAADVLWQKGYHAEAVRAVGNLAELQLENRFLLRVLGQQYLTYQRPDLAVDVYEQVLRLAPEEPQSYRDLALAKAQLGQYQQAADLLYTVIQKPWDSRFGGIQLIAVDELNQLVAAHGKQINTSQFDADLLRNRPVDLRVVLTWDSDNSDMDLWVTDPNGEKVYYGNQLSYQGGRISRDFTGGYGPEVFWLKEPKAGEYEIRAHFYGDRQQIVTGPTTAHVRLIRHWGKPNQSEQILRVKMTQEERDRANEDAVLIGKFTVK